ncbi:Uncharacterised protein [Klebsiella pneumoniae]|uniref:Uncharacterized protein n=1 Tax=Klebsiella pneumoniae TaxID=573 RepID=A0A2X3D611_KLEPN|nr:Uncharacterised protein [Klebsiella pneumoniae]HDU1551360.1 hypothetical protein [Klebsiella pneumoniae]
MTNSDIWMPAGSIEEAHQRALTWVCDAYLFYLVSLHRRPVYRHQYGVSTSGNSVTTINTTPDKTGWTCDDGVTYWK